MSRATFVGVGKPYGLQRVCRVLDFPRSTICAQQPRPRWCLAPAGGVVRSRRWPMPTS